MINTWNIYNDKGVIIAYTQDFEYAVQLENAGFKVVKQTIN
jgi:hypothetical protein